jgi:CRP/FNR family transcriptional regulator, anaerobic regulatory protein
MDAQDPPHFAISSIGSARCEAIGCSICIGLPPDARHELARLGRIRSYRAGDTIIAEAEEIGFVGNVVSGVLRMHKTLQDGRQQIVGLLLPTDMFGRVFSPSSHVAIEAASDATLCCYHRPSFEGLFARFPEIEHRTLQAISHELDAAQDWMLLLATQTVVERVATFFLILASKTGGGTIVEVPISRRDMAAYLGTTVESISRAIHQLARARIVRIIDPHRFEILDPERLSDLSGHEKEQFAMPRRRARRLG